MKQKRKKPSECSLLCWIKTSKQSVQCASRNDTEYAFFKVLYYLQEVKPGMSYGSHFLMYRSEFYHISLQLYVFYFITRVSAGL